MSDAVMTRGVSNEAIFIERNTSDDRRYLHKSAAFGNEGVLRDELAEVWEECKEANWDGYGAFAVTQETLRNTYTFLESLPLGFRRPSISADPHGHISLEWYRHPRRLLSVGITPDGLLHYAVLLGPEKGCGTITFFGEIPDTIRNLVSRVFS